MWGWGGGAPAEDGSGTAHAAYARVGAVRSTRRVPEAEDWVEGCAMEGGRMSVVVRGRVMSSRVSCGEGEGACKDLHRKIEVLV